MPNKKGQGVWSKKFELSLICKVKEEQIESLGNKFEKEHLLKADDIETYLGKQVISTTKKLILKNLLLLDVQKFA